MTRPAHALVHADRPNTAQPVAARRGSGGPSLRHVLVVGGTMREWAEMSQPDWEARVDRLGAYCGSLGVPWLTVRVYGLGADAPEQPMVTWRHDVGGCCVIVDPCGNGRQRFAEAMRRLDPAADITEATVAAALYAPADCEPDLVVVLGPPTQLPPSLVWELAYAELVFLPVAWAQFDAGHLSTAVADFAGRHRRFGGLDTD